MTGMRGSEVGELEVTAYDREAEFCHRCGFLTDDEYAAIRAEVRGWQEHHADEEVYNLAHMSRGILQQKMAGCAALAARARAVMSESAVEPDPPFVGADWDDVRHLWAPEELGRVMPIKGDRTRGA